MSTPSHRRNFVEYPLAALAAAFAFGVLLSSLTYASLKLCLTLAALASVSAIISTLKRHAYASYFVIIALAFAGASLASIEARDARSDSRLRTLYERGLFEPGEPVELTGVVEHAPEYAPDGLLFDVRIERVRARNVERECVGHVEFFAPVADARRVCASRLCSCAPRDSEIPASLRPTNSSHNATSTRGPQSRALF
jgi:hypothetical protein